MILHIIKARYVRDYVIHLTFNDGAEGYVDLSGELHGAMFEPLRDPEAFRAFRVDPELETIVWANGADLAPEFLHARLLVPSDTPASGDA